MPKPTSTVVWPTTTSGDNDRAIQDYSQAIRHKRDYVDAFYNRGNAYLKKSDYSHAIQDYDQAIRLRPDYDEAFNNRGIAYRHKGDNNRAIKIAITPSDWSRTSRCLLTTVAYG